jgi:hypothetical protein
MQRTAAMHELSLYKVLRNRRASTRAAVSNPRPLFFCDLFLLRGVGQLSRIAAIPA